MSDPKLAKAESEDVNIRANPRELCHVSYNEDLILPLTSKLEVMSTDEKTPEEIETLKTLVFDCVDTLSSSVECDEDDTDLSPTPTTERLCSKNNVLPNSASAEGDIGEFAALIAKAKEKKGNMTFSFPEPEFLKEIPKYDST
ncbi:hypothetical protein BIW11_02617 [Tropilaelaps mercedesae]|uniref:Uncharacterized protein n=1 Tax=Tropilaelaps mercedesae TaxID=418985 RepID=A0A1V9Y036_9ACAR|nr:hypothetical protein BIW11_02617 [Tropilaelaps mercedesae]